MQVYKAKNRANSGSDQPKVNVVSEVKEIRFYLIPEWYFTIPI